MFSASLELILNVAYRESSARRHTYLTLEHLLYALAHDPEGERILVACGGDPSLLRHALDKCLKDLETFSNDEPTTEPAQTLGFRRVLQTAVLHVQSAGKDEVRAGDILAAILQQPKSHAAQLLVRQTITRLDILNYISHGISKVPIVNSDSTETSNPEKLPYTDDEYETSDPTRDPLASYTTNLSECALNEKLDPLIGRVSELQRTIEILCRRRKNNPIFVGDAGVGKTALAEGLAAYLASKDVPERLRGAEVFSLDTAALLAGTRFRGDFEERFKTVISELQNRSMPILFIDEVHASVGTGSTTGGTMDLATLIKPTLAAEEVRIVGATTFDEFKQIEKDRALGRRFQKIVIEEPSIEETTQILKGLRSRYEKHHGIEYSNQAIDAAAKLANRHLRETKLPDSAIDVIDEAGAVFGLKESNPKEPDAKTVRVKDLEKVVSRMARIPEKQTSSSDKERLRSLEESLERVVFGQNEAVRSVVTAIKRARAGLGRLDRPTGSFLFTGPTGVGKTELAKQLALHLGNEFIRYDMSEYMEKHAVARLIGAPPGYVGFEQGGMLVDAVRANPYSVVLLDEIEKAHPDVCNILLQVMDHAKLTDNMGRHADFRHVIIIMTSNAGSREAGEPVVGFGDGVSIVKNGKMKSAINRIFSPEFRNRLDSIISFQNLSTETMEMIVEKFSLQLETQLAERKIAITLAPAARRWLAKKGRDIRYGARPLARLVQIHLRNPLTDEILFGRLEHGGTVHIGLRKNSLIFDYDANTSSSQETVGQSVENTASE
tara:strand:- start:69618 stop:71954 length:2337 start_codon:yes stop_codon:yes gene_type:complete